MAAEHSIKVLLIEDDELDAREVAEMFTEMPEVPVDLMHRCDLTDGIRSLREVGADVVLLDLGLPESRGVETLDRLRADVPDVAVVVITSADDREVGVTAVQHGAQDYLIKGKVDAELLTRSVSYAIERHRMQLDLRRLTDELEQSNAELKRSNEELERFAYVVAHDLKAPLRTVSGFCHFLDLHTAETRSAEASEDIAYIKRGTEQMAVMIDDLLAYARVVRAEEKARPTDFRAVVDLAVENLQAEIDASGGKVRCNALPTLHANESQMLQLLQNLLSNAVKFRGDEPPDICVTAEQQDDHWRFSVRDNGIGIAAQHRECIFDAFRRLHAKHEYDGNGIGLAICRKIVELHGGRIWVESAPPSGSVFCFTIAK
jgi:signal transduction histidine kinase